MRKEAASEISEVTRRAGQGSARDCPPCNNRKCPPQEKCRTPSCPKCPSCKSECSPCPTSEVDPKTGFTFKIYIYDLPKEFHSDLKRDQKRCVSDQYGTEIRIHEELLKSPLRTLDPDEADFFYIPIYGECYLFRENQRSGRDAMSNTNRWFRKALNIVVKETPYWNRTQGRDHIWTFPGARGPHIFKDWKRNIKKSIFLTPEGDRSLSEQFNTWKDIVIPGLEADEEFWSGKLKRDDSFDRDIFAFFKGTIHNRGGKPTPRASGSSWRGF